MLSSNEVSNCCDDCDSNERVRVRACVCVQAEVGSSKWRRSGVLMVGKRKQATRKPGELRKPAKERHGEARRGEAGEAERGISEVLARCLDSLGIIPFRCLCCGKC